MSKARSAALLVVLAAGGPVSICQPPAQGPPLVAGFFSLGWHIGCIAQLATKDVQGIYTGSRVLPLVREFDPDVALLDIALPQKSGFELAREIRKQPKGRRVLLIGISGQYKQESDKLLADITGFDHYLVKPFDPAALLALLAPLTFPDGDRLT